MIKTQTARQIMDRIRVQCGATWKPSTEDVCTTDNPDTVVTGIVTTYTPSIGVLQRAVATGKNLLITQQPAFYGETSTYLKNDPAFLFKRVLITTHNLIVWRLYDNWNARPVDGQLLGLAKALHWDNYHLPGPNDYTANNKYFQLPEAPLREVIINIQKSLGIKGIRVIGDPATKIRKAALSHGMFRFTELQEMLKDPDVDLIVVAEAIEWESPEYFRDLLTWKGNSKAMILLGREASEDPGYGAMAAWLSSFIPELPIEWIPAGEPFWVP